MTQIFFFFFRSDMANSGGSCCIIMSKFEVIKKFVPTISVHYKLLFWSTCSSCLPFIDIGICTQVENIYIPKELLFKYYEDKYRRHNFILKQNEMPSLVENCMNSIHASCCKQQSWWFQEYHPQAGLHRWKFLKVFECKSCCSAPRLGCPLEKEEPHRKKVFSLIFSQVLEKNIQFFSYQDKKTTLIWLVSEVTA